MSTAAVNAVVSRSQGRPAAEPPEARGLRRDAVRLLVARTHSVEHAAFSDLGRHLAPGDLVVVNTSKTLPAAVDGRRDARPMRVHFSAPLDDGSWTAELRAPDGSGPVVDGRSGEHIELPGGASVEIVSAYSGIEGRSRIVRVRVRGVEGRVERYLLRAGRPITYSYLREEWPLASYQTIFARELGSAEMPSAGRPFSNELVTDLLTRGVVMAPILLHTAVSSLEQGEVPLPERFRVPAATARLVNATRRAGRRVVAVGTTVTRALETATGEDGRVRPLAGWTDLVLGGDRPARVVDGLITGWHPPEASHQLLLDAVAGAEMVEAAYEAAFASGYLWHEFGDSCLLLP